MTRANPRASSGPAATDATLFLAGLAAGTAVGGEGEGAAAMGPARLRSSSQFPLYGNAALRGILSAADAAGLKRYPYSPAKTTGHRVILV
jgi:hypothetical protein